VTDEQLARFNRLVELETALNALRVVVQQAATIVHRERKAMMAVKPPVINKPPEPVED
jgi:hypothetical protein